MYYNVLLVKLPAHSGAGAARALPVVQKRAQPGTAPGLKQRPKRTDKLLMAEGTPNTFGDLAARDASVDDIFVARQPIFDPRKDLFAYELLYRNSFKNAFGSTDGTSATLNVIKSTFLLLGAQLTGSRRTFINFNTDLLKRRLPFVLSPKTTVVEILEDVQVDDTLLNICRELKEAGYVIALDDFNPKNEGYKQLIDMAEIIKVDFREVKPDERRSIVSSRWPDKVKFLAEKVETPEEFKEARTSGYLYFQGYFFGKPVIVSAKNVPGHKINYVRMLAEINRQEMDLPTMESTIKTDTYLTYALLNYINSAYFGMRTSVGSIMQALALLGQNEVRKWASLVVITFIGQDKPLEVSVLSLVRAKFCEELAGKIGFVRNASEPFLTGMFSMLDALVGRPIDEILDMINVSNDIKVALKTGDNRYGEILRLVVSYEKAEWREVDSWADKLGLKRAVIPFAYRNSVQWVEQVFEADVAKDFRGR